MKEYSQGMHDISNDDYHASRALSNSGLKLFIECPYKYYWKYISGLAEPENKTPSLIMGSVVHTLTLEPHLFDDEYALEPTDINKRTKVGKIEYDYFLQENEGKTILSQDIFKQATKMANSIKACELASDLIPDAKYEQSIFFKDNATGVMLKARPDILHSHIIVDLKTTADASYSAFQRSMIKFGYCSQAAFIQRAIQSLGEDFEKYAFIVVENKEPYCVAVYTLDEEAINYGHNLMDAYLPQFAQCIKTEKWPGYPFDNLLLPSWVSI